MPCSLPRLIATALGPLRALSSNSSKNGRASLGRPNFRGQVQGHPGTLTRFPMSLRRLWRRHSSEACLRASGRNVCPVRNVWCASGCAHECGGTSAGFRRIMMEERIRCSSLEPVLAARCWSFPARHSTGGRQ